MTSAPALTPCERPALAAELGWGTGDVAFYPERGLGTIVGWAQYGPQYFVTWEGAGARAHVPLDKLAAVGFRRPADCSTAARLLQRIGAPLPVPGGPPADDEAFAARLREQVELLRRGTLEDNIESLRLAYCAHRRPAGAGSDGFGALRHYRLTRDLVASELAHALSADAAEMAAELDARLAEASAASGCSPIFAG